MIAWFDGRARPQAERLGRLVGQDRLFGLTGLSLQPIFGLCKLLWLKENEPDAYSRTATWLNVADYMAFRLCGVAATDYSLASRTLALDLHNLRWAGELLEEVGIAPDLFAPLRGGGSFLGRDPEARRNRVPTAPASRRAARQFGRPCRGAHRRHDAHSLGTARRFPAARARSQTPRAV